MTSRATTQLRLQCLVIGLKISRQFFNQWEAKPKPIVPCARDFSHALGNYKLQVIARNSAWLLGLFAPVVIGRNNYFCFSMVIWKPDRSMLARTKREKSNALDPGEGSGKKLCRKYKWKKSRLPLYEIIKSKVDTATRTFYVGMKCFLNIVIISNRRQRSYQNWPISFKGTACLCLGTNRPSKGDA